MDRVITISEEDKKKIKGIEECFRIIKRTFVIGTDKTESIYVLQYMPVKIDDILKLSILAGKDNYYDSIIKSRESNNSYYWKDRSEENEGCSLYSNPNAEDGLKYLKKFMEGLIKENVKLLNISEDHVI